MDTKMLDLVGLSLDWVNDALVAAVHWIITVKLVCVFTCKCETWHHFATATLIAECTSVPCCAESGPILSHVMSSGFMFASQYSSS
jgi:hypothetical protein